MNMIKIELNFYRDTAPNQRFSDDCPDLIPYTAGVHLGDIGCSIVHYILCEAVSACAVDRTLRENGPVDKHLKTHGQSQASYSNPLAVRWLILLT
jgi:hypothetical protein